MLIWMLLMLDSSTQTTKTTKEINKMNAKFTLKELQAISDSAWYAYRQNHKVFDYASYIKAHDDAYIAASKVKQLKETK